MSTSPAPFAPIAPGVELALLRTHDTGGKTFFIRMAKGARAPRHDHPGGEETCIVRGVLRITGRVTAAGAAQPDLILGPGEHGFVPPGEVHEGIAEEDTLFFVVAPGGVTRA